MLTNVHLKMYIIFTDFLNDKSLITYFQWIFVKTCTVTSSLLVYETQCELQEWNVKRRIKTEDYYVSFVNYSLLVASKYWIRYFSILWSRSMLLHGTKKNGGLYFIPFARHLRNQVLDPTTVRPACLIFKTFLNLLRKFKLKLELIILFVFIDARIVLE